MKPQIIDAFMFNNELDVLNFRLHELNDYVDKFVIYENCWTFSGKRKPLYFKENKERFSKFSNKIYGTYQKMIVFVFLQKVKMSIGE